jgi:hypothetical protein
VESDPTSVGLDRPAANLASGWRWRFSGFTGHDLVLLLRLVYLLPLKILSNNFR